MKTFFLFVSLFLASCTLEIDGLQVEAPSAQSASPGDSDMSNHNPFDHPPYGGVHPWQPPQQGGFDASKNYNVASSTNKEGILKAWQGNARVTSSNTALGTFKSLASVQFPEPGIYTAEFSISSPSQAAAGGPTPIKLGTDAIRCQAILNWTVEGNQIQRIFDIGNGTTISGAGAGVNIQVQDLTVTLPAAAGANNVDYQVSVAITRGVRAQYMIPVIALGAASVVNGAARPIPNPVGQAIINAGGGFTAIFPVPINSGIIGVKVMVKDTTTPATRPTFVSAAQSSALFTVYNNWIPDSDPGFVPLVPGTDAVTITNQSAADTVTTSLIWAIDG